MLHRYACLLVILTAPVAAQQPIAASAPVTPHAKAIFEKDWVLMNWALKFYDSDRDILLEADEAQAAAQAFREMADGNRDGRITQEEYRVARQVILARY